MSEIDEKYRFGMIGLGTMGRNLLLNMADNGFAVAGYDKNPAQVALLEKEGQGKQVKAFTVADDFIHSIQTPRSIIMLVPAGKIVDDVIEAIVPLLDKGDILIDGGNSHFTDTTRRVAELEAKGFHFFGMGISGGEEGARKGASMMPGGDKQAYSQMKPVFEAIAAKADGEPCVAYMGPGAAGHFVKMVHNGIEYGLMQLISEVYGLLKYGLKLDNAAIQQVFKKWDEGRLQSFLMDVTKSIFAFKAHGTDHLLVDDIKDEAKSKGTGKWTSQVAMDLEAPVPTIDTAVALRNMSKYKQLRENIAALYSTQESTLADNTDTDTFLEQLEQAYYFSMVITYAQGMHLLLKASKEYHYQLRLDEIAKIWRGGCIIRSLFLTDIFNAYERDPLLENLLLDEQVKTLVEEAVPGARSIVSKAIAAGIAVPAFASALSYFDTLRTERMPSNLIQAQRDYFGAHTYELIGKEGIFHTDWLAENQEDLLHNTPTENIA